MIYTLRSNSWILGSLVVAASLGLFAWVSVKGTASLSFSFGRNRDSTTLRSGRLPDSSLGRDQVIEILINRSVYHEDDFVNEIAVIPPFWGNNNGSNSTLKCIPDETTTPEWGPCFGTHKSINWEREIGDKPTYHKMIPIDAASTKETNDWAGYCRPGFLIIGAGKCGTSVRAHTRAQKCSRGSPLAI